MTKKRSYRMSERAKSQEETRQRIVEATMALHEEVGPRATTISAIAERAGVQRLTVYRHFPDETAVFQACTSHWLSLNPPPDPAAWQGIGTATARFEAAIGAFYRYYSGTREMLTKAHRDVAEVPALQAPMAEFSAGIGMIAEEIIARFDGEAEAAPRIAATIRHAFGFTTWAELEAQGLTDDEKTALTLTWLEGARGGATPTA